MILNERLTVTIQSLAFGGDSIARTPDGFVLFIPGGVPGDQVEIQVTALKKKFGSAQILKIIKPSDARRTAPCPVFGICGGCQWQQIRYESQLKFKSEMVRGALEKSRFPTDNLRAILPSPREFRYRNRIQVRTQNGGVGFFQRGSHEIAPIATCPIAMDEINHALQNLPRKPDRKVELQLLKDGTVTADEDAGHGENLGFSQVNEFGNQKMIEVILHQVKLWDQDQRIKKIWDFYAGDGNFTWPLAEICPAATLEAVEYNPVSVDRAQRRAASGVGASSLSPIRFFRARVEDWLKQREKTALRESIDLVLLDPPRMGCDPRAIQSLIKIKPRYMVFIGCDLSHFIRDVSPLLGEYKCVGLVPVDLFPQTFHVETIGFFERNNFSIPAI